MRGAVADRETLLSARLSRGLTQEQLAALADVDVKTVRKAEQGKRLDLGTLTRLAFTLETELNRIMRPSPSETETQIRRRDLVMRWQRVWDAGDMEALLTLYHDDAVLYLPGGPNIPFGGVFRGKEGVRQAHEIAWSSCRTADARLEDLSLMVCDNKVILQGVKGLYLPNGEIARLGAVQVFTLEGDLILEHRVEYDTLTLARLLQLPPCKPTAG